MASSNLALKLLASFSFGVVFFGLSQVDAGGVPLVAGVALAGLALGAALAHISDEFREFTESRVAMAPWVLCAAVALAQDTTTAALSLSLLGGGLVGASFGSWKTYSRMVPALGLPLIVGQMVGESQVTVMGLLLWLATIGIFALAASHMRYDATPSSLSATQPGLVHRPQRAVQAAAVLAACVAAAMVLTPIVGESSIDFGNTPFAGDLSGLQLNSHPGLKSGELDTGRRVNLGDEVVLRVKADRPDYWRQLTYSSWDGRTWTNPAEGSRYTWESTGVTVSQGRPGGETSVAHFTVEQSGMDVVPGAYKIQALWSTGRSGLVGEDGSITLEQAMGAGAKWTVESSVRDITPEILRAADPLVLGVSSSITQRYATEADVTPLVARLALDITKDEPTTYDKIRALEAWMDSNIHYSRQIATLPEGADAVEQLLFIDQLGYCEQIGTSLVVMLRSLGIPARLVVGYVPGSYDERTNEWISTASDAHAWAEVYFPGVGWQGFDPTAGVPLSGDELEANASSGDNSLQYLGGQIVIVALALLLLAALVSKLAGGRSNLVAPRLARLNAVGDRLQRNWSDAMTIREKTFSLVPLGLDPDLAERIADQLERASYSRGSDDRSVALDEALAELEAAVDQLLKVPA